MKTDTKFIIADNQDITKTGMHGYISATFGEFLIMDVRDKKEM